MAFFHPVGTPRVKSVFRVLGIAWMPRVSRDLFIISSTFFDLFLMITNKARQMDRPTDSLAEKTI